MPIFSLYLLRGFFCRAESRTENSGEHRNGHLPYTHQRQPNIGAKVLPGPKLDCLRVGSNTSPIRTFFQIVALFVFVFLVGCQYPSSSAMSGNWTFTITSNNAGIVLATANLKQSGSQITGQLTFALNYSSCGTAATLTGTQEGQNITFEFAQGASEVLLTGTANQAFTFASGNYTTNGGGTCFQPGEAGSWTALFG